MYIPEDWRGIMVSKSVCTFNADSKRPLFAVGQGYPDVADDWTDVLQEYTKLGNSLYHQCLADLEPVIGRKRAKESARYFKTYNSQIQADVQFNMRSFANFLRLRYDSHAQKEIYGIAEQMLNLVRNIEGNPFEHTLKAWGY